MQERPASVVLPSAEDPVVGGLVNAVGGRPGAHARLGERRFWTPVRWLVLLTLLTSLLGFWQKSPCRVHPWAEEYQYTRMCYSDVFALWGAERLNEGATPYLDHPVEYPVVIGAVMAAAESLADGAPSDERNRRFFDLTWALLTACAVVVTLTTARLAGRRRPWDAAMFAVAPALVLHHSTNWDLVAMAFAGLGLVAWQRRAPWTAGALLGVATATKLYPVLFLVPLLLLCVRAGRTGTWLKAAAATVLAGLVLVAPVYLVSPSFADVGGVQTRVADSPLDRFGEQGLRALLPHTTAPSPADPAQMVEGTNSVYRFVALNQERGADWDSLYLALGKLRTPDDSLRNDVIALVLDRSQPAGEPPSVLNRAVAVSFALSLLAIGVLALRARRRPRLPQLMFLVLVAFLLTNKVFSPQYTLWLLPLAVLARPRWRPFLIWQALEGLVLFTRFYYFISFGADQGIDYGWFLTAVLLRDAALLVLAGLVVRDVLHPERDVIRTDPLTGDATGEDDPTGGVLDGAPDVRGPRRAGGAGRSGRTGARRVTAPAGPAVRSALGLWIATRVAVLVASAVGAWTLGPGLAVAVPPFLVRWDQWDVGLFRKVAQYGYQGYPDRYPDPGIEAFFPGYPLLLRVVHVVVPSWTAAGMVVSALALGVAVACLAALAEHEGVAPDRAVLYLLVSPYAVFLAAAYSESLFLALALPGWLAARRGRWATASVLVALATTVRISGAFLAAALVVELLVQTRGRPGRRAGWLLLPPAALAGYWGYLWALTGDPLRWFTAQQEGWQRELTAPHTALLATLRYAGSGRLRTDYAWAFSAEIVSVLVGVVVVGVLLRRHRWSEATYVGLSVGALATSTVYLSVNRATLLWFPLWLLLAGASARRPWLHVAYLSLSVPLSVIGVVAFTSGRWLG